MTSERICRRLRDYGGALPEAAVIGPCTVCGAAVAFDPFEPLDALVDLFDQPQRLICVACHTERTVMEKKH